MFHVKRLGPGAPAVPLIPAKAGTQSRKPQRQIPHISPTSLGDNFPRLPIHSRCYAPKVGDGRNHAIPTPFHLSDTAPIASAWRAVAMFNGAGAMRSSGQVRRNAASQPTTGEVRPALKRMGAVHRGPGQNSPALPPPAQDPRGETPPCSGWRANDRGDAGCRVSLLLPVAVARRRPNHAGPSRVPSPP